MLSMTFLNDHFSVRDFINNDVAINKINFSMYEEAFIKKNDGKSATNIFIQEIWQKSHLKKNFG